MMKCHHGITRLNNLESHDLIAFILPQLYLGNQELVNAMTAVSLLGGCAWLVLWQGWPLALSRREGSLT